LEEKLENFESKIQLISKSISCITEKCETSEKSRRAIHEKLIRFNDETQDLTRKVAKLDNQVEQISDLLLRLSEITSKLARIIE